VNSGRRRAPAFLEKEELAPASEPPEPSVQAHYRQKSVPDVVWDFRSIRENSHKNEGGAIESPLKFGLCRS